MTSTDEGTRRKRLTLRRVIGLVVATLLVATLAIVGVSYKASSTLLSPESDPVDAPPLNVPVEEVSFETSDGVRLSAWFSLPGCPDTASCLLPSGVVLAPGRGATRSSFEQEIAELHRAGFATLAFDFRATGNSERDVRSTAGAHEQLDVDAAVDFLQSRSEVEDGVAVYGKSQGAATAMLAAADNPAVTAVVDEAGFGRLTDVVGYNFETETGLPPFPFAPLAVQFAEWRADVSLDQVAPVDVAEDISPRPLLVVHARNDQRVRYQESEKVFAAAGEPKQFWTLDGDSHATSLEADAEGWRTNVLDFLNDWRATKYQIPVAQATT